MSILLPHFLKEGRGHASTSTSPACLNPVWTNPDGFTWMRALTDEEKVGLHVALTPTWSETAEFADYVLPMGHATERHDTQSYETHAAKWLGFRQPVRRVAMEKLGPPRRRHPRRQPRRGVGGERVVVRAVVADRPRRLAGHPPALRVARPAGREGRRSTSTTAGSSRTGCPACPRQAEAEGLTPLGVHAPLRRRRGRRQTSTGRTSGRCSDAELDAAGPTPDDDRRAAQGRPTLDSVPPLIGEAGAVGVQHDDGTVTRAGSPRRASWRSTPRRCATGAGPSTPRPATSESHVAPARDRPRRRRARAGAHLPAADADPHPVGQRQVPQRDLQLPPAVAQRHRRRRATASTPATWSG